MKLIAVHLAVLVFAMLLSRAVAAAGPQDPDLGKAAPEFALTAADGSKHGLADYRDKTVVLLWLNRRCPYSERLLEDNIVQRAIRDARAADKDVVWLIINSTHDTSAQENQKLAEDFKIRVPILLDPDGKTARKYGARMTPETMVIDPKGNLVYSGAFDDDPNGAKGKNGKDVTNYAVEFVRKIAAGEDFKPKRNQPYGCRIKFTKE